MDQLTRVNADSKSTNQRWIGVDCLNLKSTDGKFFFKNMVSEIKEKDFGWTEYQWVHPLSQKTVTKAVYVGKLNSEVFFVCAYYKQA